MRRLIPLLMLTPACEPTETEVFPGQLEPAKANDPLGAVPGPVEPPDRAGAPSVEASRATSASAGVAVPHAPADLLGAVGEPVAFAADHLEILTGSASFDIPVLRGALVPMADVVDLQDSSSYVVQIHDLELRVTPQQLVAPYQDMGMLRTLSVEGRGERLVLDGSVTDLALPGHVELVPSITDDGRIQLSFREAKVLGVGVTRPLLQALASETEEVPGLLTVDGKGLYIDVRHLGGGRDLNVAWTDVGIRQGALVLQAGRPDIVPGGEGRLVLSGGVLRTGGTMLFDTTLAIVPEQGGPLRIDRKHFGAQRKAGFAKSGDGRSLTLHVADPTAVHGDPTDSP